MSVLLGLLAAFVLLALLIWLTSTLVGLLLHLAMAGVIGGLADALVPGRLPYGFLGAILAGLLGSWLGHLLLGRIGPSLFGVNLVSALVGTVILVAAFEALSRAGLARRRAA